MALQRLYIADSTNDDVRAWAWPGRTRVSSVDIDISSLITNPHGAVSDGIHVWVYDRTNVVRAWNLATRARASSLDITAASGVVIAGGMYYDGTLWFGDRQADRALAYSASTATADTSKNLTLPSAVDNINACFASGNIGWVQARTITSQDPFQADTDWFAFNLNTQARLSNRDIEITDSQGEGAFTDGTHGYAISGRNFRAFQLSNGARTTAQDFTIPSSELGTGRGGFLVTLPPQAVAASFTAGDPTLAADLTAVESEPLAVAVSLAAGDPTLAFALTEIAPIEQVAVQLQAGNPTLAADATALAPITENTIRARDNEIVRALITVGDALNWFTPPGAEGTVTGDLEVEAGLEIGYIRVTRNNNGDFLTFRRPPGATTGDMNAAFGPGGTFEDSFIHLERHINTGEADGAQIASFQISSMRASSGTNWLALGPFPNTSDYSAFIDTVAAGERVNMVIGDAAFAPIPVETELSAGNPTLDFDVTAVAPPVENVEVSFEAGDPTLSVDLTAVDSPPLQVGVSLAAGNPTVEFGLTGIPAPRQVAVQFTAGNPTLAADLTALDAIHINTIPRRSNEYVRALLTASGGSEPSEWLGSASSDSDLTLTSDLIIDRIRFWTSDDRMFLNHSGTGAFSNFFGADNTGEDAHIYIAVEGQTTIIDIDIADNLANRGGQAAVAALRIRQIPTNFAAILDNIASGTKVNFVIADPAHAIETELRAGNPTLAADLTAVESEPLSVEVELEAGAPTLAFDLSSVDSPPLQAAVSLRAGDPTLEFSLTGVGPPPIQAAVAFTAGDPTLSVDLTAVDSAPLQVAVSLAAGNPTLQFSLTSVSPPQQIAVELRAGNPTLSFDVASVQAARPPVEPEPFSSFRVELYEEGGGDFVANTSAVMNVQRSRILDEMGSIRASFPAVHVFADELHVQRELRFFHDQRGYLGTYVIKEVDRAVHEDTPIVSIVAYDLLVDLFETNTFINRNYNGLEISDILSNTTNTDAPDGLLRGTRFSSVVDVGLGEFVVSYNGESRLSAVAVLADRLKQHFRLQPSSPGASPVLEFGAFGTQRDLRLVGVESIPDPFYDTPNLLPIISIDDMVHSQERTDYLLPIGTGAGTARLTLQNASASDADYPIYQMTLPDDTTGYYIKQPAAPEVDITAAGGSQHFYVFEDSAIRPVSNAPGDVARARDALYKTAVENLKVLTQSRTTYQISVGGALPADTAMTVGDSIYVEYRGVTQRYEGGVTPTFRKWVDINGSFFVTAITETFVPTGGVTTTINVSPTGEDHLSDKKFILDLKRRADVLEKYVQLSANVAHLNFDAEAEPAVLWQDGPASSSLDGAFTAGETQITMEDSTGLSVGEYIRVGERSEDAMEIYRITERSGNTLTLDAGLLTDHDDNDEVADQRIQEAAQNVLYVPIGLEYYDLQRVRLRLTTRQGISVAERVGTSEAGGHTHEMENDDTNSAGDHSHGIHAGGDHGHGSAGNHSHGINNNDALHSHNLGTVPSGSTSETEGHSHGIPNFPTSASSGAASHTHGEDEAGDHAHDDAGNHTHGEDATGDHSHSLVDATTQEAGNHSHPASLRYTPSTAYPALIELWVNNVNVTSSITPATARGPYGQTDSAIENYIIDLTPYFHDNSGNLLQQFHKIELRPRAGFGEIIANIDLLGVIQAVVVQ